VRFTKSRSAKSQNSERIVAIRLWEDTCRRIIRFGDSGIGTHRGECLTSRVAKSREDQDHPSEEDRWQKSRDLANLEVRKVRAQELGAPSHEW
jgi:hypothetical protein